LVLRRFSPFCANFIDNLVTVSRTRPVLHMTVTRSDSG
jgi:hypothetical protein